MALLAFAAVGVLRRRCCLALLIDISCPQGAQQQTRRTPSGCRTTGQMDGRPTGV